MKIVVTGSRKFADKEFVWHTLMQEEKKSGRIFRILVHGCATGVDTFAKEWQSERITVGRAYAEKMRRVPGRPVPLNFDLSVLGVPAMWDDLETPPVLIRYRRDGTAYNALAGPVRNQKMVDHKPNLCIRFPGGAGTEDMTKRVIKAGIPLIRIEYARQI